MRNQAANEYLQRHAIELDEAKEKPALERLSQPLASYGYDHEEGTANLENPPFDLKFAYKRPERVEFRAGKTGEIIFQIYFECGGCWVPPSHTFPC